MVSELLIMKHMKKITFSPVVYGFFALSTVMSITACNSNTNLKDGYLASNVRLYTPAAEAAANLDISAETQTFLENQKIPKAQIRESFRSMKASLRNSYIGYDIKKHLINKSGDEIFDQCISDVAKNSADKISSVDYYDLVLKCMARFKDSHISISRVVDTNAVSTVIASSRLIGEKLYITMIRPNLIKKIEEINQLSENDLANKIKIGFEVLLIDGETPLKALEKLQPYQSASSEPALLRKSLQALFVRLHAYPEKKDLNLTLKAQDGVTYEVTVPWVYSRTGSLESRSLLTRNGILKASDLDADSTKLLRTQGVDLYAVLFKDISNRQAYTDDYGDDALVTGIVTLNQKNYCYMQLNTFSLGRVDNIPYRVQQKIGDGISNSNILDVMKSHLQTCETFRAPLIFDLRDNGGGNSILSIDIYRLFEAQDAKPSVYAAEAFLATTGSAGLATSYMSDLDAKTPSLESILTLQVLNRAAQTGSKISDWVIQRPENSSPYRGIFSQPVYALTDSSCVSACEGLMNRFKKSGRAKVIGSATNGTGFGFIRIGTSESKFRDPLNLLEIRLPNYAFQSFTVEDDSNFQSENGDKYSIQAFNSSDCMENRPVQVDVSLDYSAADISELNPLTQYLQHLNDIMTAQ